MKVLIINYCQKIYKPNPEKLITRILSNIPDKFLVGLDAVRLFDRRPRHIEHDIVCTRLSADHSAIDVSMETTSLRLFPGFSRVLFNIVFLSAVTEHIIQDIQPHSEDQEILAFQKPYHMNLRWGGFGLWPPILGLLTSIRYVVKRVPLLQAVVLAMSAPVIKHFEVSRAQKTQHGRPSDENS